MDNAADIFEAAVMHFAIFVKLRCMLKRQPEGNLFCPMCQEGLVHFIMTPDGLTKGECSTDNCMQWQDKKTDA
jgi:hypothetical protein